MRDTTLLFLIKKNHNQITDICLAMKKRGFGKGRWNGAGGKLLPNESHEQAVIRETEEEIGVTPKEFYKVADLNFYFSLNKDFDHAVSIFFCEEWIGEPSESEEMSPNWFKIHEIPFNEMWPDDSMWLPRVINGELLKGSFTFGEADAVLEYELEAIENWN